MYSEGQGVPLDFVEAYKWVSLGFVGDDRIVKTRDFIADQLTPKQIAKAQKLAKEWRPKK